MDLFFKDIYIGYIGYIYIGYIYMVITECSVEFPVLYSMSIGFLFYKY